MTIISVGIYVIITGFIILLLGIENQLNKYYISSKNRRILTISKDEEIYATTFKDSYFADGDETPVRVLTIMDKK